VSLGNDGFSGDELALQIQVYELLLYTIVVFLDLGILRARQKTYHPTITFYRFGTCSAKMSGFAVVGSQQIAA